MERTQNLKKVTKLKVYKLQFVLMMLFKIKYTHLSIHTRHTRQW